MCYLLTLFLRPIPLSPPSGAFGKYASAIAAQRHVSPVAVMGSVDPPDSRDALPGEEELAARLSEEVGGSHIQ